MALGKKEPKSIYDLGFSINDIVLVEHEAPQMKVCGAFIFSFILLMLYYR